MLVMIHLSNIQKAMLAQKTDAKCAQAGVDALDIMGVRIHSADRRKQPARGTPGNLIQRTSFGIGRSLSSDPSSDS